MSKNSGEKNNNTSIFSEAKFKLRIEDHAFLTFVHFRDYKPDEVTMFGITKADDPLYVTEFALVKQKVNPASSDCDPEGMDDHICKYLSKGVLPLNSERIWFHSHPMTGENSANPSIKDMSTWNDNDNKHKNFMVMGILSKSGHMTCKLRIKGNASSIVAGLNSELSYEQDIPVEIIETDLYKKAVLNKIISLGGEELIKNIGEDKALKTFKDTFSIKDLFPEYISELESDYARLVSKDTPVYTHHVGISHYNYINTNLNLHEKKTVTAQTIPEVFVHVGTDISDVDSFLLRPYLNLMSSSYEACGDDHIRKTYGSYIDEWRPSANDYVSSILGAIQSDILRFGDTNKGKLKMDGAHIPLHDKKCAVSRSLELYPVFISKIQEVCKNTPVTQSQI